MTAANIEALAAALYRGECAYTGRDHESYCISMTVAAFRSFEEEIERLTVEVKVAYFAGASHFGGWREGDFGPILEWEAKYFQESFDKWQASVSGKKG